MVEHRLNSAESRIQTLEKEVEDLRIRVALNEDFVKSLKTLILRGAATIIGIVITAVIVV